MNRVVHLLLVTVKTTVISSVKLIDILNYLVVKYILRIDVDAKNGIHAAMNLYLVLNKLIIYSLLTKLLSTNEHVGIF